MAVDSARAAHHRGAGWVDEDIVVNGNLTTSRKPDDLAAFGRAFVEQLAVS